MKTLTITAALVATLSATAYGQGYYPAAPAGPTPAPLSQPASIVERNGFTIGVGFGVGQMSDGEDETSATALSLRIGAAVSPRILIVADLTGSAGEDDGMDLLHTLVGVEVVGFVTDRFYLTGGLGIQKITQKYQGQDYESDGELGVILGGGYEVMQRANFAVSAEARAFGAEIQGYDFRSVTVGVAATWF